VDYVSIETALLMTNKYLNNDILNPFFIIADDVDDYSILKDQFSSLMNMRISDYCQEADSFPNMDIVCEKISSVNHNTLLLGLGESVSLSGTYNVLGKIKDLTLNTKVIIICRGIRKEMFSLCEIDKKFNSRRRCFLKPALMYKIIRLPSNITTVNSINDFKTLLSNLENGINDVIFVKTALSIKDVKELHSAYEILREINPNLTFQRGCLSDKLWDEYLLDKNLEGYKLCHWRTFLKLQSFPPENKYHKYVIDTSENNDVYSKRIFNALLDFSINDKEFNEIYKARKFLLKDIKNSDISDYVTETKVKGNERIFFLTDNTSLERQAIIESFALIGSIQNEVIQNIYPALYEYLYDFEFEGKEGELLTAYFSKYKYQKLANKISPEFYKQVSDFSIDGNRPYNGLKTRGEVLDRLNKANTALYWVDALGVEYLGYIQNRAKTLGLNINVYVVRANLPTITSCNRDFYDTWIGIKGQTKELDKLKHEGEKDFNYQTIKLPVHLAEELCIIDDILEWATTKLTGKIVEKVIIVSDHGASRLAVINEHENNYKMASDGKHSGRCCPCSEVDEKPDSATEENDFWVLANYDRFRGGRKANVEVHGGATLEEVVIPLIELSLFDNKIEVINTTPDTSASYKKNAEIVLFSKNSLKKVSVKVKGKSYDAETIENNKFKISFPDLKSAEKYRADVYEGDNLIGQVEFQIHRESGKVNDADWFKEGGIS
jgi:hypothetical protein